MKRWPIMVGLVAYLVFCVAAWEIYRKPVDEKLEQRAVAALAEVSASNPAAKGGGIEFHGMRGILRGIADVEVAERVRLKIEDSVGWGMVDLEIADGGKISGSPPEQVQIPVSPEAKAEPTFALRPGAAKGNWIMSGEFGDDDLIDTLVLGTRGECDAVDWIDAENLRRGDVENVAWAQKLPAVVTFLISNTKNASLEINAEGGVSVGGDVDSVEDEKRILEAVQALSGGELAERLRVPGSIEVIRDSDGGLKIDCHVGTGEEADLISDTFGRLLAISEDQRDLKSMISPDAFHCPDWMFDLIPLAVDLIGNREAGSVRIDGQKLIVRGIVSSDEERAALLALANNAVGDRLEVEDVLEVQAVSTLVIVKMGDEIMLQGILPDDDSTKKLLAAIQEKFMIGPKIDREGLKVAEGVPSSAWLSRAAEAIPDLIGEMEAGQMEISDAGIEVFVGVRSAKAGEIIRKGAGEIAGDEVPLGTVDVVILEAPRLTAVLDGDKIVLSGRLPSVEYRSALAAGIRGYLSTVEIENRIEVDENVWDPKWFSAADSVIPEFLQIASGLGSAQVEISGGHLKASARLPSDELKEPIEILFSPFGRAGVKVDLKLQVLSQPRLIISYSKPKIKISGRLKDSATKTKITRAIKSVHPDGEIEDSVVLDSDVAESGWDAMVIDLVSVAMTELKDAGIDLRPGKVRIEGQVGSEKARTALETKLNKDFGAAFEIESAIRIPGGEMVAEPRFELAEREGKWAIVGMIATKEEKAALIEAIEIVKAKGELIDELEVTTDVAPSPWVGEIAPLIASLAEAGDPWISVFQGTLIVEGEFLDAQARKRLTDAGAKLEGLKFEDASTVKPKAPGILVPPPPTPRLAPRTGGGGE